MNSSALPQPLPQTVVVRRVARVSLAKEVCKRGQVGRQAGTQTGKSSVTEREYKKKA